jgi:LPS export ABC transporter protein LptC
MSFRLVWILCLIVIGGILTLSFLNQREIQTETSIPSTANKPTVSFSNINMIINSPSGIPQYKLSSPKYWLYHEEQRSEFDTPNIIIYDSGGGEIYATSEKGQTHDDNDIITLIGNVKINQLATNSDPYPLNIVTDKLTVSQSQQLITTDLSVTATRGSQKITAIGMSLNLNNKVLHLHNNVRGRYDP